MTDVINDSGDPVNLRTLERVEQIKSIAKDHFDCLLDSGATASDVKAIAQNFCEAIGVASDTAIFALWEAEKNE